MDSVGIRILGLRSSKWHSRQANDAVVSERSIFSENLDYKRFFRVAVYTIFRGLDARDGRKLRTETHTYTHTRDNYSNPCCACAPRVNKGSQYACKDFQT